MHFTYPFWLYTMLVAGLVLLICSLFTIYRIYIGSNSIFAYQLMLFTLGYALINLATFIN